MTRRHADDGHRDTGDAESSGTIVAAGHSEADRILRVYTERNAANLGTRYSLLSPVNLMVVQERERLLLEQLSAKWSDLSLVECLDVGCGAGGQLARLIADGADPRRLHGIDLREEAIESARARLPLCDVQTGDASSLPFQTASMDLVTQFTMVSSILDPEMRRAVASEMVRVCRPGGIIVSYDFVVNPRNRDTRGLGREEIRGLFPDCPVTFRSATLAPPLARLVVPRSRRLAAALGAFPFLRTHLIAFVERPAGAAAVS